MKKFLIISSIVMSIIGILISAAPFILKITGLDRPAKKLLLENILTDSGHQFDLQKIDVGLGKFEISEVSFKSSDERLEVSIDEIILEFNILEYLKSPTNLRKSLREIYFSRPQLIIHQKSKMKINSENSDYQNIHTLISELSSYKNLGIEDGQIIYMDKNENQYIYAQNLKGWLIHRSEDSLSLNLQGSSFTSSTDNFELTAEINNDLHEFVSSVEILNYNFDDPSLEVLFESCEFEGIANGTVAIVGNYEKIDSLNLNGEIEITDLAVNYKEEHFSNVNLILAVKDNSISVKDGCFNYFNNIVNVNVLMPDLYNPELTGKINAVDFPVAKLKKFFPTKVFNGSTVNFALDFGIDTDNYFINGKVNSGNLSLYTTRFTKFESFVEVSNEIIQINNLKAYNDNLALFGSVSFSNISDDWEIRFDGKYSSEEHILFDHLSNAEHKFNLNITHNSKSDFTGGRWNYLLSGRDTLLSIHGLIDGDSKVIGGKLLDSNIPDLGYEIRVSDYLGNTPKIDFLKIDNFPFHIFSSEELISSIGKQINTRILLSGTTDNLNGKLEFYNSLSNDSLMIIEASVKNILKENKMISGDVEINNLKGSFGANFNSTLLASHFFFEEGLDGEFIIDLSKENEEVNGVLSLDKFKVLQAFGNKASENDYRYQGEISGIINFAGSLKSPWINGDIKGDRFILNEIGYFQPEFTFNLDKTSLSLDSINIYHNNTRVLKGSFNWVLLTDQISGVVKGDSLDVVTYLKAFNYKPGFITGKGGLSGQLKGTVDKPYMELIIKVANGELDGIKYDKLEMNLVDNIVENKHLLDLNSHNINIESINISRPGYYHLNTVGSLPLNSKDEIDLIVKFDGDIIGLIPYWEPFFVDGTSLSDIILTIKGTKDNPRLVAANISIDRGEIWLKDVAEHIEDISGKIELKEGDNKVDINLIAHIDDNYLKINTVRDITTSAGRKLEPWLFKGLGLDFGILAMQTSADGVELHIPGIMLPGETGKINLAGKAELETFYFSGPVKHPVGYGLVTLNDANITYPFVVNNAAEGKKSTAVRFLSNMEWDATLRPGEDVLYVRQIPAYFDNVLAELAVDEKSPGIEFKGIINNGTFKSVGSLVSTRGRLEYLDLSFKVERFTLDLLHSKDLPDVSGRAWTTIRDSIGAAHKTIYLQLYAIDEETGGSKQFGSWEEFKFKLVSADPTVGETQEQVLSYLGYSVENIKDKATNVGGALTDKYLIRPLLRPVEKILERGLGVDFVRFNSKIAKNLFNSSIGKSEQVHNGNPFADPFSQEIPYLYLMSSSEVTVGKYLNENIYLTYTGQLVSIYEESETGYDMNHSFGVEYRFYKNVLLEFEWDRELLKYYNFDNQRQYLDDFKIRFRHSFSF